MWPFRPPQTPADRPVRVDEELIKRVVLLESSMEGLRTEWHDMRDQLRKSYQRAEKANERRDRKEAEENDLRESPVSDDLPSPPLTPFGRKLAEINRTRRKA